MEYRQTEVVVGSLGRDANTCTMLCSAAFLIDSTCQEVRDSSANTCTMLCSAAFWIECTCQEVRDTSSCLPPIAGIEKCMVYDISHSFKTFISSCLQCRHLIHALNVWAARA